MQIWVYVPVYFLLLASAATYHFVLGFSNRQTLQPSDKAIADKMQIASSPFFHLGDMLAQLPVNEKIELVGSILAEKLVLDEKKRRTAYLKSAPAVMLGISDSCKEKKTEL